MDRTRQVTLMYFITHLGHIFFLYPGNIISCTPKAHWIPIIIGYIVHLTVITIYMKGLSYIGKRDMVSLFLGSGKIISVLILLPVALYTIMMSIISIRGYAEVMSIVFLSNTPLWAIMLFLLSISTYIALKGMRAMLRTCVLICCLCLPIIAFFTGASFQNVDWHYVFPLVNNVSFLTNRQYLESMFAFSSGFLFLGFVQPYGRYRMRIIVLASLALLPFFLLSVYIPIMVFGQATASTMNFPYITALDTIYIPWLMFDRITIFFFLCLIMFALMFLGMVLWSTACVVSRSIPVFKLPVTLIINSVLIFVVCLFIPDWKDIESLFWWNTYLRFYVLFSVPLATFIMGHRLHRKGDANVLEI